MGGRGGVSTSAKNRLTNERLTNEIKLLENRFANGNTEIKDEIKKQVDIAQKLDGTKQGADFHGGDENGLLFKIGRRTRVETMFVSKLEDWAKGFQKPLGMTDKDFSEVRSAIKKLHQKYDYTTIAAAYNFAHTFKDYREIGMKG